MNDNKVTLYSKVFIRLGEEKIDFTIVEPKEIDPAKRRIPWDSPIAKAIMGLNIGQETDSILPNGKTVKIKVIDINPQ